MGILGYIKCPKCEEPAQINDGYIGSKVSQLEKNQRKTVKSMVSSLLPQKTPRVKFPWKSPNEYLADIKCSNCGYNKPTWGWTEKLGGDFIIYFPRKTFLLPHDELTDTTSHESTHPPTFENRHGRKWYFQYRDNRKNLFRKYSDFVTSPNPRQKLSKGYKIFPSPYAMEHGEDEED